MLGLQPPQDFAIQRLKREIDMDMLIATVFQHQLFIDEHTRKQSFCRSKRHKAKTQAICTTDPQLYTTKKKISAMNEEDEQEKMCFCNPDEERKWSRTNCKLKC